MRTHSRHAACCHFLRLQELDGQPAPPPGAEAPTTALYGHWQTEPWEPPAAEGGRVPRNERGNVEAPPFAKALPRGTRHVVVPGAAPVCRQLGVDFAPALVGFEPQGGRMVPRFEGIVVCEVSFSSRAPRRVCCVRA